MRLCTLSLSPPGRLRRQGLLKEKLQLEKFKAPDGRLRWTVAPIDEQLSFDKVRPVLSPLGFELHSI